MDLVPQRPLVLKQSYTVLSAAGGGLLLLVGLAAAGGYLAWQWFEAQDLMQTQERWDRGENVRASVTGEVQSRLFVLDSYNLNIEYEDPDGNARQAKYEFMTLVGGPDVDSDVTVRFDPQRPEAPVLSWAAESKGARWRAVLFMIAAGLLVSLSFVFLGWNAMSQWRSASLAARSSQEVQCRVLEVETEERKGQRFMTVKYEIPSRPELPMRVRGKKRKASYRLAKRGPLFADAESTLLVTLVPRDRPGVPIAMSDDMHPYKLTQEQQRRFEENVRQRGESASS